MKTFTYLDKHGVRYAVYHENGNYSWQHPYAEKKTCDVCQGKSSAAPKEKETK